MLICPKCNRIAKEGSKYCDSCSTALVEMPEALSRNEAAVNNCKKPGRVPKITKILLAVSCAVLAAVLAIGLFAPSLFTSDNRQYALYIKDGQLFYNSLSSSKSTQVTESLFDFDASISKMSYAAKDIGSKSFLSNDGHTLFYTEQILNSGKYDLYYRDLKNPKLAPIRVDDNISRFLYSDKNNRLIYIKGSTLYDFKDGKSHRMAEEVSEVNLSGDGNTILYLANTQSGRSLFIKLGDDKAIEVDSKVYNIYCSADFSTYYYVADKNSVDSSGKREVTLFSVKNYTEKKKLDEGSAIGPLKVYDSGEMYYSKAGSVELKASDCIEDDIFKTDAALKEPVKNFGEYPLRENYKSNAEHVEAATAYYEASKQYQKGLEIYKKKLERDKIREQMQTETVSVHALEMYYCDGNTVTLLSDCVSASIDRQCADNRAVMVYAEFNKESFKKVKLSTLLNFSQVSGDVTRVMYETERLNIAIGKNTTALDKANVQSFNLSDDGTRLSCLVGKDRNGELRGDLYSVGISDTVGTLELYDTNVDGNCYSYTGSDGFTCYLKNYQYSNDTADLYINKKLADEGVSSLAQNYNNTADGVLAYTEKNEDGNYTIKTYSDGKVNMICEDGNGSYNVLPSGDVLYLKSNDDTDTTGLYGLYLYSDGKSSLIDDGVTGLVRMYTYDAVASCSGAYIMLEEIVITPCS